MNEYLLPLVFIVAAAYSAVGHGGASGYLAVLMILGFSPAQMVTSALTLNLLVSGIAFAAFYRRGYFESKLFWPFAATSIPASLLGGLIHVPSTLYGALLFVSLVFAAVRLVLSSQVDYENITGVAIPRLSLALPTGVAIGVVSGMVGVGGGIFLSPLIILMKWADAKRTAAVSALFVWVNSAAGLIGHSHRVHLAAIDLWPLAAAAFFGGILGSYFGSTRFKNETMRRILAGVLAVAACKSFLSVIR